MARADLQDEDVYGAGGTIGGPRGVRVVGFRASPAPTGGALHGPAWTGPSGAWWPAVDVYETPAECIVTAEVAGVEDLQIELSGDRRTLAIRGERSRTVRPAAQVTPGVQALPDAALCDSTYQVAPTARVVCHQLEIATGPFERRMALPCAVDAASASAGCKDGLLQVVLPKVRSRGPVRVRISAGAPALPAAPATLGVATRGPRGKER